MRRLRIALLSAAALCLLPLLVVQNAFGWGMAVHSMMSRLMGNNLPAEMPAFMRAPSAVDAYDYYAPEPDRWRSKAEPEQDIAQQPDHFIDMEYADLLGPNLPRRRYDYIRALAAAQAANPTVKMTPEGVGTNPYMVDELYERLKLELRNYRALVAAKGDTKPIEAEILFMTGWLAHYVEDGSNPMHASAQYNGWTGPNPHGYTTAHTIHAQFERIYVLANIKPTDVQPLISAKPVVMGDVFVEYMTYLHHSNSLVERAYEIDKAGGYTGAGTPEAKVFVAERLAAGVNELRNVLYTAWIKSADPVAENN